MSATAGTMHAAVHDGKPTPLVFREMPITIQSDQGPYEITAMVGEQSGLAYHWDQDQYCITSLSTGKRVL